MKGVRAVDQGAGFVDLAQNTRTDQVEGRRGDVIEAEVPQNIADDHGPHQARLPLAVVLASLPRGGAIKIEAWVKTLREAPGTAIGPHPVWNLGHVAQRESTTLTW